MKNRLSIAVAIANKQRAMTIDRLLLRKAIRTVIGESDFTSAEISVAIVDDFVMAELNEEYLNHVGPTDVLSFMLETANGHLDAELIIDAETAIRVAPEYAAPEYAWSADEELLLYAIHGALHLIGYDDATARQRAKMRSKEQEILNALGVQCRVQPGRTR